MLFFISEDLSNSIVLADERLKLGTTTSVENSGLLDVIIPPFEKKNKIKISVIAGGSGQALKLGESGDVDIIISHAPELEKEFIKKGFGIKRKIFMKNDFVIVGPSNDRADVKRAKNAVEAFKKILLNKSNFISRGDKSGTHMKEISIWKKLRISKPYGSWYQEAGRGMGETLIISNEKNAYTITDRGTYLALKNKISLQILFEGDASLDNLYSVITVNPKKFKYVKYEISCKFIDWLISNECQKTIANFKDKNGNQLFVPLFFKK
ncbi:MAG: substrate-binding domain-containing protein [Acidobacteriota bacterium]